MADKESRPSTEAPALAPASASMEPTATEGVSPAPVPVAPVTDVAPAPAPAPATETTTTEAVTPVPTTVVPEAPASAAAPAVSADVTPAVDTTAVTEPAPPTVGTTGAEEDKGAKATETAAAAADTKAAEGAPKPVGTATGTTAEAAATPDAEATVVTPGWPAMAPSHPLLRLHAKLPSILSSAAHDKIWGVTLSPASPPAFSTLLVLQKYLRSTAGDVELAGKNLQATLAWRKEFGLDQEPAAAVAATPADDAAFKGLGYVTQVSTAHGREVVTWNVYGAAADLKATFGDLDRFLHWRVALMERAMRHLHLDTTTIPIPDHGLGEDPHRIAQVHVYTGVSFLRMDPAVKAASKATITLMGAHYPETLSRKFFVGVPLLMSWVFAAVRMFVKEETAKKFVVVSYPANLAPELGDKGDVPAEYGGTGPELAELEKRAEAV